MKKKLLLLLFLIASANIFAQDYNVSRYYNVFVEKTKCLDSLYSEGIAQKKSTRQIMEIMKSYLVNNMDSLELTIDILISDTSTILSREYCTGYSEDNSFQIGINYKIKKSTLGLGIPYKEVLIQGIKKENQVVYYLLDVETPVILRNKSYDRLIELHCFMMNDIDLGWVSSVYSLRVVSVVPK